MEIPDAYRVFGIELDSIGARWRACCPFHAETKPSFVVYEDGSYHCFGCQSHGSFEDVLKKINKNNVLFPSLDYPNENTILYKLYRKFEGKLKAALEETPFHKKCKAYDAFDTLLLTMQSKSADVSIESLSIAYQLNIGYKKIINYIQNSS